MGVRTLRGIHTSIPPITNPFDDILRELDAEAGAKVHVLVESRRYGKVVTIVDGLEGRTDLAGILRALKQQLATGGSAKNGVIELQGDHRTRAAAILASRGIEAEP